MSMSETLPEIFERFARDEFHSSSALYERLSNAIARDAKLLALAARCRKGERIPNLLFGAVHYLLLTGISHPLGRFYKSLGGCFDGREDPFPDFRSFCLEQFERIGELIAVRMVQTNEVNRCAGLMPLFRAASKGAGDRPFFIVDFGASAGLNLFWDQYGYRYGDRLEAGDRNSPVQIECALRGLKLPTLPVSFPPVAGRVGVDLNPLDVRVEDDALWLRALIWPEHEKRAELLRSAIALVRQRPLKMLSGDGVELLPDVMRTVPAGAVLCIVRVFTPISQQSRGVLTAVIADYAAQRDVMMITARPHGGDDSELCLTSFVGGRRHEHRLAHMQNHGDWIEWLNRDDALGRQT
jgi:hypothetical protein